MDDPIEAFTSITGQSEAVARQYLGMTDNNYEQAIGLFFEAPELAASQNNTLNKARHRYLLLPDHKDLQTVPRKIHLEYDEDSDAATAAAIARAAELEDDAAMARRMQEEFYAGGDASGGLDADGMRLRSQARAAADGGPGQRRIFNQRAVPSIWDASNEGLAQAAGGASEGSSKHARLAELFRPPFDLMYKLSWIRLATREKRMQSGFWSTYKIILFSTTKNWRAGQGLVRTSRTKACRVSHATGRVFGPIQSRSFQEKPVARRKPEKPKSIDVDRLTEQEMLDLALQNSLANNGTTGPRLMTQMIYKELRRCR
ncbi:hypothetical protein EYC84_007286 [Monilinia fructicola]|uniref:UBA domain-containing protein n=1 Tax=Monilinia fructicola TaxID=38448 RepID=A0A5M9K668_MONFR|nr:hypothetical protein EYC84_007286 [Monilinia fructicola]